MPYPHISYLTEIDSMRSPLLDAHLEPGLGASACHKFIADVVRRRFLRPSVPVAAIVSISVQPHSRRQ